MGESIVSILLVGVGFLLLVVAIFQLGKLLFHFVFMMRNVLDTKYYWYGPLLLLSDRFFSEKGKRHRAGYIRSLLYSIVLVGVLMGFKLYIHGC